MRLFYTKVSFIKQSMSLGIWINLPNIIYIHRGICRKNFRGFPMVYIQITKQGVWGAQPRVIHSQTAFVAIFLCFITQFI